MMKDTRHGRLTATTKLVTSPETAVEQSNYEQACDNSTKLAKSIELTCPDCKKKIAFKITITALENAGSESGGLLKRAITHNPAGTSPHVVIVHLDGEGNVRRVYPYQCADTLADTGKITEKGEEILLISPEEITSDPNAALQKLCAIMGKQAKNG